MLSTVIGSPGAVFYVLAFPVKLAVLKKKNLPQTQWHTVLDIYYAHSVCGSGLQRGHSGDGLSRTSAGRLEGQELESSEISLTCLFDGQ